MTRETRRHVPIVAPRLFLFVFCTLIASSIAIGQQLDIQWIKESETFPANQEASIDALLFRVEERFETLLQNDTGIVKIRVRFEALPAVSNAVTDVNGEPVDVPTARQKLIDLAQKESGYEIALYKALPQGPIPVVLPNGATASIAEIIVPYSLYKAKWFPQGAIEEAATIKINLNKPWDYLPVGGITSTKLDLEQTVTHETMHALGFFSRMEISTTNISVWDMFRLSNQVAGGGVPGPTFTSAPRVLQLGTEVVGVNALAGR